MVVPMLEQSEHGCCLCSSRESTVVPLLEHARHICSSILAHNTKLLRSIAIFYFFFILFILRGSLRLKA